MSKISVLNPVKTVSVQGVDVEVREMRHLDMIGFLKLIHKHVNELADEKGAIRFSVDRLTEIITGAEELSLFLLSKSTGKDTAWVAQLSFSDALILMDTALELSFSEDVIKNARQLGGRVKASFGLLKIAKPTSPPHSTS